MRDRRHHLDRAGQRGQPDRFTRGGGSHGGTGYPQARLLALVARGTRTLIDAVSGPTTSGETTYAPGLLRSLRAGMVVLADRNFAAAALIAAIARTEADVLVRVKNGRKLPPLRRYRDGSYLSRMGAIQVRVIEAQTAYLELKSTLLGGRVLRARTPAGIDQEIYALLVTYQILRTAMADATACVHGTGPDRASFTIAWQTARDQLIQAAGIIASTVIGKSTTSSPQARDPRQPRQAHLTACGPVACLPPTASPHRAG